METRESFQYITREFAVVKSDVQKQLEAQGCRFKDQELLSEHELDVNKPCYCGRPCIAAIREGEG
jgi:hypothetical protein